MKNQTSLSNMKIYLCTVLILICGISIGIAGSFLTMHFLRKYHSVKPAVSKQEWAHNFAVRLAEEFNLSKQQSNIAEQAHLDFSYKISKLNAKIIPEVLKADAKFLAEIQKVLPSEDFNKWEKGFIRNRNKRLKMRNTY